MFSYGFLRLFYGFLFFNGFLMFSYGFLRLCLGFSVFQWFSKFSKALSMAFSFSMVFHMVF